MNDVFIRRVGGFPRSIEAVTVVDSNGDYNVLLNSAIPQSRQRKAFRHELAHIRLNHFESHEPLRINELEAGV